MRNSAGTYDLGWADEKNFLGMYERFTHALHTRQDDEMPLASDALIATYLATTATNQAIEDRDRMIHNAFLQAEKRLYDKYLPSSDYLTRWL